MLKTQPQIIKHRNSNIKLSNGHYGHYGRFLGRLLGYVAYFPFFRKKLKLDLGRMKLVKDKQFIDKKQEKVNLMNIR